MLTYPSTYGVFEDTIRDICDRVHYYGGQVHKTTVHVQVHVHVPYTLHVRIVAITLCIPDCFARCMSMYSVAIHMYSLCYYRFSSILYMSSMKVWENILGKCIHLSTTTQILVHVFHLYMYMYLYVYSMMCVFNMA